MDKDDYDEVCYINVFSTLLEQVKTNAISYNDKTAGKREARFLFSKQFIKDITTPSGGLEGEKPAFETTTEARDFDFYDYSNDADVSELTSQQKSSYVELFRFVKYLESNYLFNLTNIEATGVQGKANPHDDFTNIDNFFGSHYKLSRGNDILKDTDKLIEIHDKKAICALRMNTDKSGMYLKNGMSVELEIMTNINKDINDFIYSKQRIEGEKVIVTMISRFNAKGRVVMKKPIQIQVNLEDSSSEAEVFCFSRKEDVDKFYNFFTKDEITKESQIRCSNLNPEDATQDQLNNYNKTLNLTCECVVRNERKNVVNGKDIVDLYNLSGDYLITIYNFIHDETLTVDEDFAEDYDLDELTKDYIFSGKIPSLYDLYIKDDRIIKDNAFEIISKKKNKSLKVFDRHYKNAEPFVVYKIDNKNDLVEGPLVNISRSPYGLLTQFLGSQSLKTEMNEDKNKDKNEDKFELYVRYGENAQRAANTFVNTLRKQINKKTKSKS